MTINEFLARPSCRISYGDKWLYLDDSDNKYVVRGHDYMERGTHVIAIKNTLDEALDVLVEDSE